MERKKRGRENSREIYKIDYMGLDWKTPGYMVRKEIKRWMKRGRADRRAWTYEK